MKPQYIILNKQLQKVNVNIIINALKFYVDFVPEKSDKAIQALKMLGVKYEPQNSKTSKGKEKPPQSPQPATKPKSSS